MYIFVHISYYLLAALVSEILLVSLGLVLTVESVSYTTTRRGAPLHRYTTRSRNNDSVVQDNVVRLMRDQKTDWPNNSTLYDFFPGT